MTAAIDPESDRRLDVTISKQFNTIFLGLLGMPKVTITRQAVGEYTLPVPMGSPLDAFGDNSGGFWTVVAAQGTDRGNGDAFGSYYNPNPTLNTQYLQNGYDYAIDVPAGAGSTSIDLYDPTFCAVDPTEGHRRPLARRRRSGRRSRPTTRCGPTRPRRRSTTATT